MEENWKYKVEEFADKVIKKAKEKNLPVVCRCGETPGGTKHIGNFNDNIRSYFIYLSVKEKGYPAKHIQTRDNMDPFRKLPAGFFDLNKKWHISTPEMINSYQKYVGMPLYFIPDPLGCCENYSEHFRKIYEEECAKMGLVDTEYFSTYELYKTGKFNEYLKKIFENIDEARKIDLSIEKTKPKDYVPVWAICEKCKKITGRVAKINLEEEEVEYTCTGRNLTSKYPAIGCGHNGKCSWKNGNVKMDWEFEWPAQMLLFDTTIEPFGKEHFIGSWPFAKQVISKVYKSDLPLVFYYEYFLVDKQKMATRHGNVTPLSNLLKIIEPEVIRYIYTKRPRKQRNLNSNNILNLVNEFDFAEKVYFGLKKGKNKKEEEKYKKNYEFALLKNPPKIFPDRVSYPRLIKLLKKFPKTKIIEIITKEKGEKADFSIKRIDLVKDYLEISKTK